MLKSYFGEFGSSGSIQECTATVRSVFSNLSDMQLYCKVLIDEIHIKPSIRCRGNHIVGNSVDHPEKPAKTILALMVCCMMCIPLRMNVCTNKLNDCWILFMIVVVLSSWS